MLVSLHLHILDSLSALILEQSASQMKMVRIISSIWKIGTFYIPSDLATQLEIGLEKVEYTAHDNADYHIVCANVKSGSVGGRKIDISYVVEDNGIVLNDLLY